MVQYFSHEEIDMCQELKQRLHVSCGKNSRYEMGIKKHGTLK